MSPSRYPQEILEELRIVCQPLDIDGSPSFVFDFLTCKMNYEFHVDKINILPPDNFHWIEVKTGNSRLSSHQQKIRERCKMQVDVFRVENVDASPHRVKIFWEESS